MAIDSPEKLSKAKELIQKAEMKLNSQLERPDYSDDLPEVQKLKSVLSSARSQINSFESGQRPVDPSTNRLTDDVGSGEEIRVGEDGLYTNEYFYEPSLESVRSRIESDPTLSERLGLPKFGKRQQMVGQQAVQDALQQQGVQPLPSVDTIDANSSVYKAVADADWRERAEQAKKEGKSLARYSKIKLKDSPVDAIAGGAIKQLGSFGSAVAGSLPGIRTVSRAVDEELLREGRKPLEASQQMDEMVDRAPVAGAIGTLVGAARPGSVGNIVGNKVASALNYGARSPVGKAAVGGASGALGSVAEGEAYALDEAVASEDPEALDNFISQAGERATGNAIFGGGLGAGGDILSQAAKIGHQTLRESPRFEDINKLRDAGGETHLLKGVTVPDNIKVNISAVAKPGSIGRPEDIAATKIVPKIADSIDQQVQTAYRDAGESLEKYHSSKEGQSQKRVTGPARVIIDMIRQGLNKGDLGTTADAVPKVAKKLRERLNNIVEKKEVDLDEFDRLKTQYGDDVIDLDADEADNIFGTKPDPGDGGSIPPGGNPGGPGGPSGTPGAKNYGPEATADTNPAGPLNSERPTGADLGPSEKPDYEFENNLRMQEKDALEDYKRNAPTRPTPEANEAIVDYGDRLNPFREARLASDEKTAGLAEEFKNVLMNNKGTVAGIGAGIGAGALSDENSEAVGAGAGLMGVAMGNTKLFKNLGSARRLGARWLKSGRTSDDAAKFVESRKNDLPPPPGYDDMKYSYTASMNKEGANSFADMRIRTKKAFDNLSPEEQDAVSDWINASTDIRNEQNTGLTKHQWKPRRAEAFESAVEKMTVLDPTKNGPLFRHFKANDDSMLADLLENDTFVAGAHTSTSYGADDSFGPHQMRFKKVDSAGSLIGANPAEGEMIIPKDARFKVTGRYFDKDRNGFVFDLEEIPTTKAELDKDATEGVGYLTPAAVGLGAGAAAGGEEEGGAAAMIAGIGLKGKGKGKGKGGKKTVLVPRAMNSRQIEKIQQDIAEDLQGISKDSGWLKSVDKAFRETRDQFAPNEFTPGEMSLDDGTKVSGLSALQRKHHEAFQKLEEMKADTSVNSRNAIHNKVRGFNTSGNYLADQQLLEEAKKLGIEDQLREVAGSAVAPSLKARAWWGGDKGLFQGTVDAALFRADPLLRTVGNVPPNPFTAAPNTPAARIQQYLFENAAKNLLNTEGGRLGRFGNELNEEVKK